MSNAIPTITLEIGNLDKTSNEYPLRLYLHNENGREKNPQAAATISKDKFKWTKKNPDPIELFLTETGQSADFQKIGEYFYALLHQGAVADEWDAFASGKPKLRVLLDIKPAEIAALPWELVSDGLEMLAVNPNQTFIRRYQPTGAVRKLPSDSLPLRVLIVIGAKDNDAAVLPWKEVWRIKADICKFDRQDSENQLVHRIIDIEVLPRPNSEQLEEVYTDFKPHVFHFIGHGRFNADKKPYLSIDHFNAALQRYEPIEWTAKDIYNDLIGWNWLPGFVFINSCRSDGTLDGNAENKKQAWSIGDVFRRLGIPAVLTMQADINGEAAGVFAGAIYKSLAELDPLDTALGHARRAVRNYFETFDKRDWAIPVLTVAAAPEEALPLRPKASEEIISVIKQCAPFKDIEYFSDRAAPRRALIRGFYPLPPVTAGKNLIVVRGGKRVGKSWLAKWSLEVCALLNHDVRYVELSGETKPWLDALLQISGGNESEKGRSLIYRPLKTEAFNEFNWKLKHRIENQSQSLPPWDNSPILLSWDGANYFVGGTKVELNSVVAAAADEMFETFRQSLSRAAKAGCPLTIVLDNFAGMREDDIKEHLIPKLIQKIADDTSVPVKFILVFSNDEYDKFKNFIGNFQEVTVDFLSPQNFVEFFEEYARYKKPNEPDDKLESAKQSLENLVSYNGKQEWTPEDLFNYIPKN